jgi:hypothetical protein
MVEAQWSRSNPLGSTEVISTLSTGSVVGGEKISLILNAKLPVRAVSEAPAPYTGVTVTIWVEVLPAHEIESIKVKRELSSIN